MKNLSTYFNRVVLLSLIILLGSCVNFKPGWNEFNEKSSSKNIEALFQDVNRIELNASSADSLLLLIDALKLVEQADPENYTALWKIGNYNVLMGAAYATKTKDKKNYYREAIRYCEKAMSTNKSFSMAQQNEKEITESFSELTINEVDAMGNWYIARFYYYKECLKPMGRILNTKIVIQNNVMIERIDQLDPNWSGGGNYFSRALYYIALPEKFGGSKERASDEFVKAINVGPNYLIHRWGRAKYLYSLTGNEEGFKSDLEWVIKQDPYSSGTTYPWNIYIQNDARKMLDSKN